MPTPWIEPQILDAAIDLFGTYGPYGVTFHDLAARAKVTSGSIYRIFGTREQLFEQAVKTVLNRMLDPANFLFILYEGQKGADFPSLAAAAVRKWYGSLSRPGARLLMQAQFLNHKWQESEGPIQKIIKVLATGMEREMKKKKGADAQTAARALVLALFQLKLSLPPSISAKEEKDAVEGILQFWIRGNQNL